MKVIGLTPNILQRLAVAVVLALALMAVGWAVWALFLAPETRLSDTLFWVGAIPVVLFSFRQIGRFTGRGDPTYQLSRQKSIILL